MKQHLSIGEVAARAGLTARALRLYETRGLVSPGRTPAGRRAYGPDDLARIATIRLLKEAGFRLSEIGVMLKRPDTVANVVPLRLAAVEAKLVELKTARARLTPIAKAIADGSDLTLDMAVALIHAGEAGPDAVRWAAAWQATFGRPPPDDWCDLQQRVGGDDPDAVNAAWHKLAADITNALHLDPAGPAAQVLLERWNALVSDFQSHATPEQQQLGSTFWSRAGEWGGDVDQPITGEVIDFVRRAGASRDNTEDSS